MDNIRELLQKREALLEKARQMLDAADREGRALTDEEARQYDELLAQADRMAADVDRRKRLVAAGSPILDMPASDLKRYSILQAIRALASGDWSKAGLERAASEETARRLGREPRGFFVPLDLYASNAQPVFVPGIGWQYRDLTKGTPSAGGYLVATELMAEAFIDMLRNRMVVARAGATVLSGLQGDVAIPKQTGGATAYWVAESGAPTESQLAVGQVALSPKTVGAYTDISRKLLLQSSLDVEAMVRRDLATVIALAIDYAALHGSGTSNQPTGVASTSGIGLVVGGTNGAAPTYTHIVSLETEVAVDNADVGRLAYITNAKVRGKLKTTFINATYGEVPVWGPNDTMNGYPAYVSNQVRSDLTKGSGTNLSAIFFGNWGDLIIGQWGALDILVDPYTGGTSGTVRVIAFQDVDVAVRYPESFAAMLDAVTT